MKVTDFSNVEISNDWFSRFLLQSDVHKSIGFLGCKKLFDIKNRGIKLLGVVIIV
jgi:hypothetical protein